MLLMVEEKAIQKTSFLWDETYYCKQDKHFKGEYLCLVFKILLHLFEEKFCSISDYFLYFSFSIFLLQCCKLQRSKILLNYLSLGCHWDFFYP